MRLHFFHAPNRSEGGFPVRLAGSRPPESPADGSCVAVRGRSRYRLSPCPLPPSPMPPLQDFVSALAGRRPSSVVVSKPNSRAAQVPLPQKATAVARAVQAVPCASRQNSPQLYSQTLPHVSIRPPAHIPLAVLHGGPLKLARSWPPRTPTACQNARLAKKSRTPARYREITANHSLAKSLDDFAPADLDHEILASLPVPAGRKRMMEAHGEARL
eukprot:COSAG06_NODE_7290_length_2557_cov_109.409683_2_plen_215_part_00